MRVNLAYLRGRVVLVVDVEEFALLCVIPSRPMMPVRFHSPLSETLGVNC